MHRQVEAGIPASGRLAEAIRYAIATEGKRIRPLLCYAVADLLDVPLEVADIPAVAIELTHVYSLVHDDLPAMDDDDLRRGKPTLHKVFDEATGILVGDALQTLAFETLATAGDVPAACRVEWVSILARAAGASGMIRGQAIDLEGETRSLGLDELEQMHRGKTGALIEASLQMVVAAADNRASGDDLGAFGRHIGLAFQVRDDILDVEASTATLGKPAGSDEASDKSTFVSILGLDEARLRMDDELAAARQALARLEGAADGLHWIADYIVARSY